MNRASQQPITPFTKEYSQIVDLLLDSFVPMKGVPMCLLEEHTLYFAGTTATALLALHHIKALPRNLYQEFHETLFWMRDNTQNLTINKKKLEDSVAWDVAEGPSVWTTSIVIWALLGTGYAGPQLDEIKDAALWVIKHQGKFGGWEGKAGRTNNLFLTGIVLHALRLVLSSPAHFTIFEREQIKQAIVDGLQSIRATSCQKHRSIYWNAQTDEGSKPDSTSTLCAIWALYEEGAHQDKNLIEGGIHYLKETLQGQAIWNFRSILAEPAIHSAAIRIVSFTPSFVIPLLRIGCSPFDDICLAPIQWLEQNRIVGKGWPHSNFGHEGHPLTFTTAYGLWAIWIWHKYASMYTRTHPYMEITTKRALRSRIHVLLALSIMLTVSSVIIVFHTFLLKVFSFFQGLITEIINYNNQIQLIITILTFVGISGLIPILRYLDSNVFRKGISRILHRIGKYLRRVLYAE